MSRVSVMPRAAILGIAAASGALLLLSAGASGCGPDPTPPVDAGTDVHVGCDLPFIGDPEKATEIELIALKADYTSMLIAEGDSVALLFPPQGGRVIFAGVRARNIDPCGIQLSGAVRDLDTAQLRVDSRTVNLADRGDGWAGSSDADIASFANVPMCPNQWSKTNIHGTKYDLEVSITDRTQHKTTKKVSVVPACAEPDNEAECTCICKGGYVLGETCSSTTSTSSSSGGSSSSGSGGAGGMTP